MKKKTKKEVYKPEISNYPEEINIQDKNYWFNKAKIGYELHYYHWKNKPFPSIFEFASDEIKNDREIVLFSITEGKTLLHQIPEHFLNDRTFVLEYLSIITLEHNYFSFICFPDHIKLDEEILNICFSKNHNIFRDLPYEKKFDKEFVISLVKKNGLVLEYLPPVFKEDPELVIEALKNAPTSIRFINKKTANIVCKDVNLIRSVLSVYPEGYEFISSKLRNDIEFSKPYLNTYHNISFIGKKIKDDFESMLFYAKHGFLFHASQRLKSDSSFMLQAIAIHALNFRYIDSSLNTNILFHREIVKANCRVYPLLESYKDDPIILCTILEHEKILNPEKNIYTSDDDAYKFLDTIKLIPKNIIENLIALEFPKLSFHDVCNHYKEELRLSLKSLNLIKKMQIEFKEKIDTELNTNQKTVRKLKV